MLTCRSSAKVNLSLDVLSRRADGYHELQSIVHTVRLWDRLTFEMLDAPACELICSDARLGGEDNLCLKAVRAWLQVALNHHGLDSGRGVRITLEKNIPTGAGLGGGSGNAAATLLALNRLHGDLLSRRELHRIGATLGADVPLFLDGGCVLMEGIGERLTPLPALNGWLVVVQPHATLSTPEIYRRWDDLNVSSGRGTAALRAAVEARDLERVANALHNDLSRAAQSAQVDVQAMVAGLHAAGAINAAMTGSGSAVFGIFRHEAAARQAARSIEGGALGAGLSRIAVADFCRAGIEFLS